MGCLLVVAAMFAPRLVMVGLCLLTGWFGRAFDGLLWPVLGFFFLPYTTLAYLAGINWGGGIHGGWLVLLIVAVLVDLGVWGGGKKSRRKRARA